MAGPSLSGPLRGWTSSSLTPTAAALPGVAQAATVQTATKAYEQAQAALAVLPPGFLGKTPEQLAEYTKLQQKVLTTRRALNAAVAGNDPAKMAKARLADLSGLALSDVPDEIFSTAMAGHSTGNTGTVAGQRAQSPGFQERTVANATEFLEQAKAALAALPTGEAGKTPEQVAERKRLQEVVSSRRSNLDSAIAMADGAAGPSQNPFAGVGSGMDTVPFQGGSLSRAASGGGGGGNLDQYNLTPSELGGRGGSGALDPRRAVTPTTGLESLLAAIFPDAAAGGAASNPFADPRNPGAAPSLLNTILGNLGTAPAAGTGGSSFAGPSFAGPGAGIANTIPGAPPFLGGAIDRVQGAGSGFSGFVAPPVVQGGGFNSLAGIAAISAEQRIQQQQMEQARAAEAARYYERVRAQQAVTDEAARLQRLRGGVSGWGATPPNMTETQAWLQSYSPTTTPVFQPYVQTF